MGDRSSAIKYQLDGRVDNWSGKTNESLEQFYMWNVWNEGLKEDKKL
jgi:hypothetical protein